MFEPVASPPDPLTQALRRRALHGGPGSADSRVVASGEGWRVVDILCTAGPRDRPYEERQMLASMSLVLGGSFTYRGARGASLLSKGSWLLVNAERPFECSHEHGTGDRCLSFQFEPALLEEVVRDTGTARLGFETDRLPPLRDLSCVVARAEAAFCSGVAMEEIAFELAGTVLQVAGRGRGTAPPSLRHAHRIVASLRLLERQRNEPLSLRDLARAARLSPYHFLRTFKAVTGVTPHQWLLRARLRDAARRLATTNDPVTDVAFDVGFEDLSNFIRSFRSEFGLSPRRYRARRA